MNNPHHNLHQFCKEEKQKAMSLCQWAEDSKTRYNAEQAIYAWDELVQQLQL